MEYTYCGKEDLATAEHLMSGETCYVTGYGNSMTPILQSGQSVIVEPVSEETELKKKDIVLCKVNGHYYLHFIHSIKNGVSFLIGNNHGHMNGWISRSKIYGVVREIL
jgi:phage repressor protein C with HTH and peptisase S24 domain